MFYPRSSTGHLFVPAERKPAGFGIKKIETHSFDLVEGGREGLKVPLKNSPLP
jgi:hypothetical protein